MYSLETNEYFLFPRNYTKLCEVYWEIFSQMLSEKELNNEKKSYVQ